MIIFSETKNIGSKKIFELFESVGWIQKGNGNNDCNDAIANHVLKVNKVNFEDLFQHAFLNSTYVASAWDGDKLIGIVRVISDKVTRSIVYDLIVHPDYQKRGIGTKLGEMCLKKFPKTQFTIGTSSKNFDFYKKKGFKNSYNYMEKESKYY